MQTVLKNLIHGEKKNTVSVIHDKAFFHKAMILHEDSSQLCNILLIGAFLRNWQYIHTSQIPTICNAE